jgi:hypothetical protein
MMNGVARIRMRQNDSALFCDSSRDIIKCRGLSCPIRFGCYRYLAEDSVKQIYLPEIPYMHGGCVMFWPLDDKELANGSN